MQGSQLCGRCGTAFARDAEACPRCLFGLALPAPGSEAELVHTRTPAARPEPPALEEIARALPGFDRFEPLGRGGMGVVYKARNVKLERFVALKVLPRALGADPAFRERFLREARALARLAHQNIVAVHEFGEADGLCYLVMELVDGVDLRQVMRERKLSPREALAIARALCDALQYAHDEGVVHRDVKPENVLVDRAGRVKIADFGLAKLVGLDASANLTATGQVMGTPHYMAPEQLERPGDVDHRADLFALGVVLYEMLTGSLPRGAFELPSHRVQVDVRLDEIVLKALEREPARRYQQAVEVKTDVERVEATEGRAASPARADANARDSGGRGRAGASARGSGGQGRAGAGAGGSGGHGRSGASARGSAGRGRAGAGARGSGGREGTGASAGGFGGRGSTGASVHDGDAEGDSIARAESFRSKRALERRVRSYPLRGMRAFALCLVFWILAGAAWNLGPLGLGAFPTALWILAGLLVHGRLLALPELAAELDRARANEKWRALASMLALGLGFAAIAVAHLAHWERGVDDWHPAYRGVFGLLDAWTLDPGSFVRLAGGNVSDGQDVAVRFVAGTVSKSIAEIVGHSSQPLFFIGFALLVLGFYAAVRPREAGALRGTAWKVAGELGSLLFGTLVVLWVVSPMAAMRREAKLESVERQIVVPEDPAVVAELLRIAFSEAALTIDVDQEVVARDERSGDELAHGFLLRAASSSPFVRWTTTFAGPLRITPQVWATIASAGEAGSCTVLLRTGLYAVRSNESDSARAELVKLEAALTGR